MDVSRAGSVQNVGQAALYSCRAGRSIVLCGYWSESLVFPSKKIWEQHRAVVPDSTHRCGDSFSAERKPNSQQLKDFPVSGVCSVTHTNPELI